MADGAGGPGGLGGLGGTLFEAAQKTVGNQVKSTAQAVGQQITGKPVGQKPGAGGGGFNLPSGQGMPSLDDFGDFGSLFEQNQLGGKKPAPQASSGNQQVNQQQLQQMQSQQQAEDAQKIAQLTQELHQMYSKKIMNTGEEAVKKEKEYMENLRKEEEEKWQKEKEEKAQEAQSMAAPGQMQAGQLTQAPVTAADRSGEAGKHTG